MQLSIILKIGATIAGVHSHHGLMSPDWRREQFERLSTDASVSTRKRPGCSAKSSRSRRNPAGACLGNLEFENLSETNLRGTEVRRANLQRADRRISGAADRKVIIASVRNS
jgi:hypothetical protein